jgi:hypothetical protein
MSTASKGSKLKYLLPLAMVLAMPTHAADVWAPITNIDLKIKAGSPLDFSAMLPSGPAGSFGRVVRGEKGNFVFADKPGEHARLQCASMAPPVATFPDHATADIFAQQLKLHGYNTVRLMYVEGILMAKRTVTNSFDPVQLDNFYYLLSALKNAGVYWMLDMMSSENGTLGDNESNRWVSKFNLKLRVNLDSDQVAQQNWRDMVSAIYASNNPYTGMSTLADPALAGVVLVNESNIGFLAATHNKAYDPLLQAPFNAYLKTLYQTDAQLQDAWGSGSGALTADEHLATNSVALPAFNVNNRRLTTFQTFATQMEANTSSWMRNYLRSMGYEGFVTSFNNWDSTQANGTRSTLDASDTHAYFNEIQGPVAGTKIDQTSALALPLSSFAGHIAATRHAGKPFTVTEYGQVFWNQFRFEASAMVPSMAALQGWDFICMHAEPGIDLSFVQPGVARKDGIHAYGVGIDPVLRAGETLSALLFMRGDVAASPNRVTVAYPSSTVFNDYSGTSAVPPDLRILSFVTGFEIKHPEETPIPPPGIGLTFYPALSGQSTATRIAALVDKHILPPSAVNNTANGLFESDTGQLAMDSQAKRYTVRTARTEALTTAAPIGELDMNVLKVHGIDGPALLSASTLNAGTLADSEQILMIFATDAMNSGMTFEPASDTLAPRSKLVTLGHMPVLLRQGLASATLALKHKSPMRLVALDLTGQRQGEIATTQVETDDGIEWSFTLDNIAQSFGPTTFFLLEKRPAQ